MRYLVYRSYILIPVAQLLVFVLQRQCSYVQRTCEYKLLCACPKSEIEVNVTGTVRTYSTVLEKVNFAHRARNAFEREPSEREGPNFSKASSIECNERDHSKSFRASSSARLSRDLQFSICSV